MRILVCGASGFIGSAVCGKLAAAGHDVIRGVRRPLSANDIAIDFTQDTEAQVWIKRLDGINAVVNAVGIICEKQGNDFETIHYQAPVALFSGCVLAGVKRVVQISALGADHGDTRYFKSKNAADQYLMGLPLEWQILYPSLVYGENGASSSLFRILSSLPVTPVPDLGDALFQPLDCSDLAEAVAVVIDPHTPARQRFDLAGPDRVSLRAMLQAYRQSLGLGAACYLTIPAAVMTAAAKMASLIPGALLNSETWQMLRAGNTGNGAVISDLLKRPVKAISDFIPADRAEALRYRALSIWHDVVLRYVLATIWIISAVVSLFIFPVADSLELLRRTGLSGLPALGALYGAAIVDFLLGAATLFYPSRMLWLGQALLIAVYSIIIACALPEFLVHPFGPVLKNLAILAILLILYSKER